MKKHTKYLAKIRFILKTFFWFGMGVLLGLFFVTSFAFFVFQRMYGNTTFPGIKFMKINIGGKTKQEVFTYFDTRNKDIQDTTFTIAKDNEIATISAKQIQAGFDSKKITNEVYGVGRSKNNLANLATIAQLYLHGLNIKPTYTYSQSKLLVLLAHVLQKEKIAPIDAQFAFQNGRVNTFRLSSNGQEVDTAAIMKTISLKLPYILMTDNPQSIVVTVPLKIIKPMITSDNVNNLGITELIGTGSSLFHHSIPSRVYNIGLATSRINGVLIAPGEVFSFDKVLGDVTNLTGYKQAYVIVNGKTVLGDGGGVCQVSTTLFRAILNAGLPIIERHGHAYRVGYYEEDTGPGIDATIYVPTVDLKFKNDTTHHILIQAQLDPTNYSLSFNLYGTKDGRTITMTKPTISNQTPPPPDIYQDDPTLPAGVIKQTDFAAGGAQTVFTRTVMKDNKTYLSDTFITNYQPWHAVYLRGTGPAQ